MYLLRGLGSDVFDETAPLGLCGLGRLGQSSGLPYFVKQGNPQPLLKLPQRQQWLNTLYTSTYFSDSIFWALAVFIVFRFEGWRVGQVGGL